MVMDQRLARDGASLWGGGLLALGALGVVATSILYGMSPPAAAMPQATLDLAAVTAGAVNGAATMRLAGIFGVFGDIAITAGAFVLAARVLAEDAAGAAGWFLIGASTIVFAIVDAMVGFVLPPLAAAASPTLLGMKQLFDVLFLVGTAAFGAGAALATLQSAFAAHGGIARLLAVLGFAAGLVALVSGGGSLIGVHLERYLGFGILGGSAIFTLIGMQIALFPKDVR
jgi:hypothetical protein